MENPHQTITRNTKVNLRNEFTLSMWLYCAHNLRMSSSSTYQGFLVSWQLVNLLLSYMDNSKPTLNSRIHTSPSWLGELRHKNLIKTWDCLNWSTSYSTAKRLLFYKRTNEIYKHLKFNYIMLSHHLQRLVELTN
jgi:hypothetical protein